MISLIQALAIAMRYVLPPVGQLLATDVPRTTGTPVLKARAR